MNTSSIRRFESIEEAQEYVKLLGEVVDETRALLKEDFEEFQFDAGSRQVDALRLVDYKLEQLRQHLSTSSRLLNDLRTLRRALYGERETEAPLKRP